MKRVRNGKPGRIPRLNDSSLRRLRVQLGKPPSQSGLTGECWSGALLGSFLLRRWVELSPRQCRRLLSKFGVQRSTPVHKARPSSALIASTSVKAPQSAALVSDSERKLAALRKMQRLCSSGLPLEPLVQTLFELIEDAIPNAFNKVFLADPGDHPSRYLVNNPELAKWTPIHKHYYIEAPPEVSGMRYSFGRPGWRARKVRWFGIRTNSPCRISTAPLATTNSFVPWASITCSGWFSKSKVRRSAIVRSGAEQTCGRLPR